MATAPELAVRKARRTRPEGVDEASTGPISRWAAFLILFGLYLTLRGYHAFDGDQAYRLPLLFHRLDPSLYASDPFVRAFDAFNPHRGYLALLDVASRPLGLAVGLAGLFALTFGATAFGIDRLARSAWPGQGGRVGLVAIGLVLLAKGGNIGTNHLFEATLLDRLIGFAMGWLAISSSVANPGRGAWAAAPWLGLAALVHPSVGLQIALTLGGAWLAWGLLGGISGVGWKLASGAVAGLGLAMAPALFLMSGQGGRLFEGLAPEEFRLLAVMVQGPQHMLPSTWRTPQWLAWGCYPVLALLAMGRPPWTATRARLALLMGVNLASLGLAYLAVEVIGDLRVTVFQPFRMATLARGLALVVLSGRILGLWDRGDLVSRSRAVLIGVGLSGDWTMVVATAVDLAMSLAESVAGQFRNRVAGLPAMVGLAVLGVGLAFLARHDTESGHLPILTALAVLAAGSALFRRKPAMAWSPRRIRWALGVSWALPVASAVVPIVVPDPSAHRWPAALVAHCRFAETPTDDLERLALWCREQTPPSARFIGPPGPKSFRLWSRRSMAFNRGGSPYHAEGLLDWSDRYRDHVAFAGSTADFARAYLADRHRLEARYEAMTDAELASLAGRQGATHVLGGVRAGRGGPDSPLERLRSEGRYAVYRVRNPVGEAPSSDNHLRRSARSAGEISEKISSGSLFNRN